MERTKVALAEHDETIIERLKQNIGGDDGLVLVGATNNGIDAWNLIIEMRPDVMVIDLLLPYMDGFELLDKINKNPEIKNSTKIIITSWVSTNGIVKESFKLGADYFIIKPYDIEGIKRRIKQISCIDDNVVNGTSSLDFAYDVNMVIQSMLNQIGLSPRLKGYAYMVTALKEILNDSSMMDSVTKILYPTIAKKHKSTSIRVEKAIRHAIEVLWAKSDVNRLSEYMGTDLTSAQRRPTNSEFIALLSQKLRQAV